MTRSFLKIYLILLSIALGLVQAEAQQAAKNNGAAISDFGSSSEPIKITSDQLDVFDKDNKAIFIGNVIAVQGDSTLKCTKLEVFYAPKSDTTTTSQNAVATAIVPTEKTQAPKAQGQKTQSPGLPSDSTSIERIECTGPVTIVSKTQIATGDHATFEKLKDKFFLKGNVILNDGSNVTKGKSLVYDLKTGIAKVEGGRVSTLITPNNAPGSDKK